MKNKTLTILDKDYVQWIKSLIALYKKSQIKAAIKVNTEQLKFYWLVGRDIVEMKVEERWGQRIIEQMSIDLKKEMPGVEGLSVTNLRYCRRFYQFYSESFEIRPQLEGEFPDSPNLPIHPQVGGEIFCIPWGHHKLIMDKVKGDVKKALL